MSLGYPNRWTEITGNEILQKESAKLHALRAFLRYMSRVVLALVPHCLVPYVLPCLTCLVLALCVLLPDVPRALRALVPHVSCTLHGLVPHVPRTCVCMCLYSSPCWFLPAARRL